MAAASPETLFEEISDYFVARMTPEAIIAFKPSKALDERLHDLLDKNSENALTREERTELDRFLHVHHAAAAPLFGVGGAFGAPTVQAWDAGMACPLQPDVLDEYFAELSNRMRLAGRLFWPAIFDLA